MIGAHALWARVRLAWGHRPWTVDLLSGVEVAGFGGFMKLHPDSIFTRQAWSFLDPLNLDVFSSALIVLGITQFAAALINVRWGRWITAFFVMWVWASFAFGLHRASPDAIIIVLVLRAALANVFILARLY